MRTEIVLNPISKNYMNANLYLVFANLSMKIYRMKIYRNALPDNCNWQGWKIAYLWGRHSGYCVKMDYKLLPASQQSS